VNVDTWRTVWRVCNTICLIGIAQFIICTFIAMQAYPGGSVADKVSSGFRMYDNFLSDLGRRSALNGDKNDSAAFWFNNSLIILSISLLPFYLSFCFHAWDRTSTLWIAAGFGVFSLFGLLIAGLTPLDRYFIAHHVGLAMWITGTIFASGLHAGAMLSSKYSPMWIALVSFSFAMLMMAYAVAGSVQDYVKMQKIAVAGAMCWYGTLSVWVLFKMEEYIKEVEETDPDMEEISHEASQYALHVRHGGSRPGGSSANGS
jgi:hypothetical membrane protein